MTRVLIVYWSDYGNTKKMAEAAAKGVGTIADAEAVIKTTEEATAIDVTAADALVIGSPTHMGSMDWHVKKFIDEVCGGLWMKDALSGRVGGVFATGSGYGSAGGGCEMAMLSMISNLAELGLVVVPLPKHTPGYPQGGLQWGPYGRSAGPNLEQKELAEEPLVAARHHGANIARLAVKLGEPVTFAR
ncbi:MAG TPA: flavodoxin domain-containing protein [Acidobacteriota bacterium]|nr:flavodoxin domain-containing protein [Acidobacteriota bacterium]